MANSAITTDLFKFMSVRAITKPSIPENDISYIRDKRMNGGLYLNTIDPEDRLGLKIMNEIFGYLLVYYDEADKSYSQKKEDNNTLLNSFEANLGMGLTEDGISEKSFVDDLVLVINKYLVNFDKCSLIKDIECVIKQYSNNQTTSLNNFIYNGAPSKYYQIQNDLFNWLYILYIFKRKYPVNLEYMLTGIRALNVIFWLNHDNQIEPYTNNLKNAGGCLHFFRNILGIRKDLAGSKQNLPIPNKFECDFKNPEKTLLNTAADLNTAFNATVAISPVLSSLCFYKSPFNAIKRVGIGDLKIVKEKLLQFID